MMYVCNNGPAKSTFVVVVVVVGTEGKRLVIPFFFFFNFTFPLISSLEFVSLVLRLDVFNRSITVIEELTTLKLAALRTYQSFLIGCRSVPVRRFHDIKYTYRGNIIIANTLSALIRLGI